MKKPQVTGRMDIGPQRKKRVTRAELQKKLATEYDRDHELVTGVFKNLEHPASGGTMGMVRFGFKKYPQDDYEFWEFLDGHRYTIPRMIARHLNQNCFYYTYANLPNSVYNNQQVRTASRVDGRMKSSPEMYSVNKKHRFAFHSLEFMDDEPEEYTADIAEVRTAA